MHNTNHRNKLGWARSGLYCSVCHLQHIKRNEELFRWQLYVIGEQNPKTYCYTLQWSHNVCVSNRRGHVCLRNRLFSHRPKKTSKLRVSGLCEGNSPVTGEFLSQRASNTENVSIWWRHHVVSISQNTCYQRILWENKREKGHVI